MRTTLLLAGLLLASPALSQELVVNGGFETGNYSGWTTSSQTGSEGSLYIDTPGTTTPVTNAGTASNPTGGSYYSVTDQNGPGAYSLTQQFTVPIGTTALTFSFDMFVNNYSEVNAVNPAGLDYTATPNQHARVDLLLSGADPFSTAGGDVLANFFLGSDPFATNPNAWTSYSFDIFGLITPGQSYQVRFAEVDNQFFFNQGVDNVSILATGGAVPEPGTWAMMLMGFGAVGFAMRRRKQTELTLRRAA